MTFTLWGQEYDLCRDEYNCRGETERAIEIPIASKFVAGQTGEGLEVGNVLSYYQPITHRVVDRYEMAAAVENRDVFAWREEADWILSISTLEHIRWDEPEQRRIGGSFAALIHCLGLLRPGGRMLVTIPWGWNPPLDYALPWAPYLKNEALMVRQPGDIHDWRESDNPRPYGGDTEWADAVWIGEFQKP